MKKMIVKKDGKKSETVYQRRPNERGSALVMVLLISSLLLVASVGILLEASLNTANVSDAINEQQAYQAAESGIQTAINALRRNVAPNPLIGGTNASDPVNRINFRKAVTPSISNKPGDTNLDARLSRWLDYSTTHPDRVVLSNGTGAAYDPQTGYAYSVTLIDPDDSGKRLDFETSGTINGQSAPYSIPASGANRVIFTYIPKSTTQLDVSNGATPATNIGKFNVLVVGLGATLTEDIPFAITINMTEPFYAQRVLRGFITKGTSAVTPISMGGMKLKFDTDTYELMGSEIVLSGAEIPITNSPIISNTTISASMSQAEPLRLMVRSVGYGPRGSQKVLEAFIRKNLFDGLPAPATLTMIGDTSGFVFNAGESQNVTYSGVNVVNPKVIIPPIGANNDANLGSVISSLEGKGSKADIFGTPANIDDELPAWLDSPQNLEKTLSALKEKAKSSGRYFPSGNAPDTFGDINTATGITFVEGDVDLHGNGGGILVCTGQLSLKGNFSFKGLIIVTGTGGVIRKGGGNGTLQGNMVIAPYDRNNIGSSFLAPKYDMSGGGTSEIVYNSSSVGNGQEALSNFVLGVAEK